MSNVGAAGEDRAAVDGGKRYRPLSELVCDHLRESILQGRLKPGERIRQEAVALRYGTSRIPVREALHQLVSEGLVTYEPNVGARVARLDLAELEQIYQLRELLEPYAIAQSAPNLTDEDLDRLRQYVEQMEDAGTRADAALWVDLDRTFHLLTFAGAPLPRLRALIEGFWSASQQYRRAFVGLPERLPISHAEHRLLLEALERRNGQDAASLLSVHIRRTRLTLGPHVELFAS